MSLGLNKTEGSEHQCVFNFDADPNPVSALGKLGSDADPGHEYFKIY